MTDNDAERSPLADPSIPDRGPGPFARAALFCDQVIQGDDLANTLVRVFDRYTTHADLRIEGSSEPPAESVQIALPVNGVLFVSLMHLNEPEDSEVQFLLQREGSADRRQVGKLVVGPSGPLRAATIRANLSLALDESGIYYIDVVCGRKVVATTGLQVEVSRNVTTVAKPKTVDPETTTPRESEDPDD